MIDGADHLDLARFEGHTIGLERGRVWVTAEVYGNEPAALWQLLEAHAWGWRAIAGSRRRLPLHRLKLCPSCGWGCLVAASHKRCRFCDASASLREVRMRWGGEVAEEPAP